MGNKIDKKCSSENVKLKKRGSKILENKITLTNTTENSAEENDDKVRKKLVYKHSSCVSIRNDVSINSK